VSHLGERVVSGQGEIEELRAEKAKDKALSDLIEDHNQARHVSGHEFTRAEQPRSAGLRLADKNSIRALAPVKIEFWN